MLESIFVNLTGVLEKSWYLALLGSFLWGILSVILSPCHMGSIPLIVAFVNRQGKITCKKAFAISLIFSLGILFSIAIIGSITGISGRMLGDIGNAGFIIVAAIFIVVGLYFLGLLRFSSLVNINYQKFQHKGLLSGFFLGIVFGLALGPCTFAFMAPILAIAFTSSSSDFVFSIVLIFMYAAGHCIVFVFFGTFGGLVQKVLNWDEKSKGMSIVKKIIGLIMIVSSVYVLFNNVRF